MLQLNAEQILALLRTEFPDVERMGVRIDALDEESITVAWPDAASQLRPGGTTSGPAIMTLVDTAAFFLVLAHVGPQTLAVTTNLNVNFLRKPSPDELIADARLLKRGSRLVVVDVGVRVASSAKLVAHASVTYSLP